MKLGDIYIHKESCVQVTVEMIKNGYVEVRYLDNDMYGFLDDVYFQVNYKPHPQYLEFFNQL